MAETQSTGGKGLKKRLGPLSLGGWLASLGGAAVVYILFRRYEADKTAASAAAGGGTGAGILTAGGTIPTTGLTSTTAAGAPFSSYAQWLTAAIAQMTSSSGVDAGTALNGITDWLSGQCVTSTQYQAISQTIANESIGLPPGYGSTIPALSVCSTSPTSTTAAAVPVKGTWAGNAGFGTGTFDQVSPGQVIPNGIQLFYEPVAGSGIFEPINYIGALLAGTPLYILQNPNQPTGYQQGNNNPGTQVVGTPGTGPTGPGQPSPVPAKTGA